MIRQSVTPKQTRDTIPNSNVMVFFQVTVYLFEASVNCLFFLLKFKNVTEFIIFQLHAA